DLPALRKTAGFAHHSSHHFCSFCPLPKDNIQNVERESWPPSRSWSEHLSLAEAWRDAMSDADREKIFNQHGLRWSQLLRLPYWDPTRFALVDAMHNLFLGELQHHCVAIWGLKTAESRGSHRRQTAMHTLEMQQSALERIVTGLRNMSHSMVASVRKDYLEAVVKLNIGTLPVAKRFGPAPTKADYATALFDWDPDPPGHTLFSGDVLNAIRSDISSTYLPSWMPNPPRNFGSASHGKLKADLWRTVCTVNLVITLVRLWGSTSSTAQEKLALKNFLHLITAVDLATRRTMSPDRAQRFDYHMLEYLRGLQYLYDAKFVPNHHLSLHLRDCLLLFGPTWAWWAFPFERYNGLLQRLNTNNRAGLY
ncbi:hypothetical protein C8Q79DRAFT_870873, partial [Trametes meyenii]